MALSQLFYCKNKDTYPPFKNGLYLEEHFLVFMKKNNVNLKKKYIPILWTNFQIEPWFKMKRYELQKSLDNWVNENPSPDGYFTVVQHDDGPLLKLPKNTTVYGACSGNIPIPLIYEDANKTLEKITKKKFIDKSLLCSFVGNRTGSNTSKVRQVMFNVLKQFDLFDSGGWTPNVHRNLQNIFIEKTVNSKFALAPRGYGRSSFRFFEIFQLGTIPIYIWDDINWLPFQNIIDYDKLCIVVHVSKLHVLENQISSINEEQYSNMWKYYDTIKHLFTLKGMTETIIGEIQFS